MMFLIYAICDTIAACPKPVGWLLQLCTTACLCHGHCRFKCTPPYVITPISTDISIIAYGLVNITDSAFTFTWPTSDYAVYCRIFCAMSTSGLYIICSMCHVCWVLPIYAMALLHILHVIDYHVPWALPCCVLGIAYFVPRTASYIVCCVLLHVLCRGHCCFIPRALLLHIFTLCAAACFVPRALLFCAVITAASHIVCYVLPHVLCHAHCCSLLLYGVYCYSLWALWLFLPRRLCFMYYAYVWFWLGTVAYLPRCCCFIYYMYDVGYGHCPLVPWVLLLYQDER